eukprot:Gb_22545 [translate_table: standard]
MVVNIALPKTIPVATANAFPIIESPSIASFIFSVSVLVVWSRLASFAVEANNDCSSEGKDHLLGPKVALGTETSEFTGFIMCTKFGSWCPPKWSDSLEPRPIVEAEASED